MGQASNLAGLAAVALDEGQKPSKRRPVTRSSRLDEVGNVVGHASTIATGG